MDKQERNELILECCGKPESQCVCEIGESCAAKQKARAYVSPDAPMEGLREELAIRLYNQSEEREHPFRHHSTWNFLDKKEQDFFRDCAEECTELFSTRIGQIARENGYTK